MAQDANVQRVEITGSSIKRATAETASPVQVISRDDLMKSGKATVAEYLQTLTADGAGSLPTGFGNGFAAGSTAISLRGLGATSTLVLLNGRRMAPFARADDGQKSFTDLSTVPMEIVERIEILKDGASSTYGADAIAGVVNIILRKDFHRPDRLKADTGISGDSDAKQHRASLTFGKGNLDNDKYNFVFNAEYSKSDKLMNSDRADRKWIGKGDLRAYGYPIGTQFACGYISGNNDAAASPTGSIRDPDTSNYVSLPGCSTLSVSTPQDPKGGCLWHHDQFRSMQPKIESINLYTRGTWQVNADTQVYAEAGYSKRDTAFTLMPPSITPTIAFPPNATNPTGVINYGSGAGTTIVLAANHPQNPYGVPVRVRYPAFDVGPSTRTANNEFNRIVLGVKGTAMGWDYDAGYTHSESKLHLDYSNMLNMAVVKDALGNPNSQYFPYYIGAQAGKNPASLYAAMVTNATSRLDHQARHHRLQGLARTDAAARWRHGPGGRRRTPPRQAGQSFAVGHRKRLDQLQLCRGQGRQKVSAVFLEVLAPVFKTVELSGALRYDKYDRFSSTTPKLGAKWTPLKTFALRGTYSEGFRAPGPAESMPTRNRPAPRPCAIRSAARAARRRPARHCDRLRRSVAAVKIGDPSLKPEKSKGYTLGLVWDPFNDTSLSLDGWKIKRENEINPLPYNEGRRPADRDSRRQQPDHQWCRSCLARAPC